MSKVAILILADTETPDELGRTVEAMISAKAFADARDDIRLIFDGAATKWPYLLSDPGHHEHRLYQQIQHVAGICSACDRTREHDSDDDDRRVHQIREHHRHPSVRTLIDDGFQVIAFV